MTVRHTECIENLIFVIIVINFRIHEIVVCPFSTILTYQMEWWQLIDFENPDNKVRVVRNLYV
jgi:hypothetical protein